MENFSFIKGKIGIIVLFGVMVGSLAFLFMVFNEKNFKANSDYLIVQNASGNQDSYTLAKSADYVGKVLGEAVYSEMFINEIAKTGKVSPEFLPFDKKEKLKQWSKSVLVSRNSDLGIISIAVFNNDERQVRAISDGIAEVLTQKNNLFRGEGQSIGVKVLSGPVVEKNPSVIQIATAIFGGFLFGALICIVWLYYAYNSRRQEIDMVGGRESGELFKK